jgi:transposase
MKLYGAIDLHSTNNVTVVINEQDQVLYQKRLPNDLPLIAQQLSAYQASLEGIVVESTYNWYWLVDGLMEKGHRLHLANTAAIQQYNGLKYSDDQSDARWLAHLLRLGVLPQGYIYPKQERAVRDLLRKRGQLVHQRTANLLSIQSQVTRNTGSSISANRIKALDARQVDELLPNRDLALAVKANLSVMNSADAQIEILEKAVHDRVKLRSQFRFLKTVPGIGPILALTIMLETGEIERFARSAIMRRTVGVWAARKSATANVKEAAIQRTATSIWPGRLSRQPILPSALAPGSKASIRKRNPRATRLWPSKQWRTSSAGLATTLLKIRFHLISPRRLPEREV